MVAADCEVRVIAFAGADATDRGLLRYACRAVAVQVTMIFLRTTAETIAYLNGSGAFGDRTRHPLPEILVLHLKRPHMNAWEVLEWLKVQSHLNRIQLCFVGDTEDQAAISRAKPYGRCFFAKPPDVDSYIHLVETLARSESHPH